MSYLKETLKMTKKEEKEMEENEELFEKRCFSLIKNNNKTDLSYHIYECEPESDKQKDKKYLDNVKCECARFFLENEKDRIVKFEFEPVKMVREKLAKLENRLEKEIKICGNCVATLYKNYDKKL